MKTLFKINTLSLALMTLLFLACQPKPDTAQNYDNSASENKATKYNPEEEEIIAFVEKLLVAAGNYNIEQLDSMCSDHAVIGYSYLKDGIWTNTELTIEEYLESVKNRELRPFSERPTDYDIITTDGRLALVRADAILSRFGTPINREINHLTLIKEVDDWKVLSIAWTVHRIPEEEREFDLELFTHSYAQAWGSQRPGFVAMYFTEDGSLQINDGDPALGRIAISEVAQSFMIRFPDMKVHFDSLVHKSDGTQFHWTFTGTDADPNGKGHQVKVSGYELWTMSDENLVKASLGNFPTEEYNRQLEFGIEK